MSQFFFFFLIVHEGGGQFSVWWVASFKTSEKLDDSVCCEEISQQKCGTCHHVRRYYLTFSRIWIFRKSGVLVERSTVSGSNASINCSTSNWRHAECILSSPSIDTKDHSCTLLRQATMMQSIWCDGLRFEKGIVARVTWKFLSKRHW